MYFSDAVMTCVSEELKGMSPEFKKFLDSFPFNEDVYLKDERIVQYADSLIHKYNLVGLDSPTVISRKAIDIIMFCIKMET